MCRNINWVAHKNNTIDEDHPELYNLLAFLDGAPSTILNERFQQFNPSELAKNIAQVAGKLKEDIEPQLTDLGYRMEAVENQIDEQQEHIQQLHVRADGHDEDIQHLHIRADGHDEDIQQLRGHADAQDVTNLEQEATNQEFQDRMDDMQQQQDVDRSEVRGWMNEMENREDERVAEFAHLAERVRLVELQQALCSVNDHPIDDHRVDDHPVHDHAVDDHEDDHFFHGDDSDDVDSVLVAEDSVHGRNMTPKDEVDLSELNKENYPAQKPPLPHGKAKVAIDVVQHAQLTQCIKIPIKTAACSCLIGILASGEKPTIPVLGILHGFELEKVAKGEIHEFDNSQGTVTVMRTPGVDLHWPAPCSIFLGNFTVRCVLVDWQPDDDDSTIIKKAKVVDLSRTSKELLSGCKSGPLPSDMYLKNGEPCGLKKFQFHMNLIDLDEIEEEDRPHAFLRHGSLVSVSFASKQPQLFPALLLGPPKEDTPKSTNKPPPPSITSRATNKNTRMVAKKANQSTRSPVAAKAAPPLTAKKANQSSRSPVAAKAAPPLAAKKANQSTRPPVAAKAFVRSPPSTASVATRKTELIKGTAACKSTHAPMATKPAYKSAPDSLPSVPEFNLPRFVPKAVGVSAPLYDSIDGPSVPPDDPSKVGKENRPRQSMRLDEIDDFLYEEFDAPQDEDYVEASSRPCQKKTFTSIDSRPNKHVQFESNCVKIINSDAEVFRVSQTRECAFLSRCIEIKLKGNEDFCLVGMLTSGKPGGAELGILHGFVPGRNDLEGVTQFCGKKIAYAFDDQEDMVVMGKPAVDLQWGRGLYPNSIPAPIRLILVDWEMERSSIGDTIKSAKVLDLDRMQEKLFLNSGTLPLTMFWADGAPCFPRKTQPLKNLIKFEEIEDPKFPTRQEPACVSLNHGTLVRVGFDSEPNNQLWSWYIALVLGPPKQP